MLNAVKKRLRISNNAFDDEINEIIESAKKDLENCGIKADTTEPLVKRAIYTFAQLEFGDREDYEQLKASYDEQRAQLKTSQKYKI